MTKVAFFLMLLLPIQSFGQSDSVRLPSKELYQQKSESQRYLAKVFLIGGSAMMFTGMFGFNSTSEYGASDVYGFMFLGGSIMALSSVPLFISSSRNAKKAEAAVSLQHQRVVLPPPGSSTTYGCPSVTVTIRF